MNLLVPFVLIIGLLPTPTPAFASNDQPQAADPPIAQVSAPAPNLSITPTSPKSPFAGVFRPADTMERQKLRAKLVAELLRADAPETEVICGLTVRHVDERSDPRIIVRRRDRTVDAKIRRILPQACRRGQ
jgi:hypothetical protein